MIVGEIAKWIKFSHAPLLEITCHSDSDNKLSREEHVQWANLVVENVGYEHAGQKTRAARGVMVTARVDGGEAELLYFSDTGGGFTEERNILRNIGLIVPIAITKIGDKPSDYKNIDTGKCYITAGDYLIANTRKPLGIGKHIINVDAQWDGGHCQEQFTLNVLGETEGITIGKTKGKK